MELCRNSRKLQRDWTGSDREEELSLPDLQPHYEKEFRCIGPECEDLCCRTWNVYFDKATYEKYQAISQLRSVAEQHLVRIQDAVTDSRYAQLVFPAPSHTCPFLTTERWCSVHRDFGPAYLSPICHSYPRVQEPLNGMTAKPLHLSCPEAARLVLFQKNLVPVERNDADDRPRYQRFLRKADQSAKTNGNPQKHYSDVQTFSLLLIHDRAYPLWQRLFLLGMFSRRISEVFTANDWAYLPGLLAEFAEIVKLNRLGASMEGIPVQTAAQLAAVVEVAHRLQNRNTWFVRMQECIQDFIRGIRYDANLPMEAMAPAYAEAHDRYYRPFVEQHPSIMENYLSNYIFRTQFPRGPIPPGEPNTPLTSYFLMCLQYAMIKGLLIGMAGHYREQFGAEHVVKLVQSFSKMVEHSSEFLRGLKLDLASPSGMALLLKN